MITVAAGSLVAFMWPGLDVARRIAAPCAIILSSAATYAFVLGMLRLFSYLPRVVFLGYSYAFFYGGIFSVVMYPLLISTVLHDSPELSHFEKVLWLSGALPISLAAAAGAYTAINSERAAADVGNAHG